MNEKIAVIGAGQMGNGIAHVFAQSGFDVTLVDVSGDALQRARDTIAKNLERQVKKGTIAANEPGEILGRIKAETNTGAVGDAGLVIEAATENEEHTSELQSRLHLVCR